MPGIAVKCPPDDAGFADSPLHGLAAQRQLVRSVLPFCTARRRAVDVGAHIGTWSLHLADAFDHVEAFEPVGANFDCLAENTKDCLNVTWYPVAAGKGHGKCRIERHGDNSGTGYVLPGKDMVIVPLDMYYWPDVDFIKIDVEGMEGDVLLGAADTLVRSRPAVFFEDNGLGIKLYGEKWVDPKVVLRFLGYRHRVRVAKNELWTCSGSR